ncbi:hypothetical protein CEXT_64581 [Caerostris extrusa]|uniref:Uncharacterized protein n=1 Tax=Caerostris extrusa TaxID=172846 RepID=A0AAV4R5X1_CAEEX|nr:hypothetical protein CEXT_64581 [Caerostris extrusa]
MDGGGELPSCPPCSCPTHFTRAKEESNGWPFAPIRFGEDTQFHASLIGRDISYAHPKMGSFSAMPKMFEHFFSALKCSSISSVRRNVRVLQCHKMFEHFFSAQTVRAFLQCTNCSSRSPQEFIPGEEKKCPNCSSRSP